MNFANVIPYSATTADPRTNPGDVLDDYIFVVGAGIPPHNDQVPVGLGITLEGTAGNTATFELWAQDEPNQPYDQNAPVIAAADRRFYKLVAALVVTVGTVTLFSPVFRGKCYLRCTVAPAAAAVAKIVLSPRS